ncbi:MAG: tetratricopeptide repeat protein [Desulfuromonadaceae bacterium]|nr:tetratricopeptide repeat protein [Desulfuromonadaceae bacterium]
MNYLKLAIIFFFCFILTACATPEEKEYNQGVDAEREGHYDKARSHYLNTLGINPSLAEAYLNLGALAIKDKDFSQAQEYTLKALELFKKNQTTIVSATVWQDQAALACNNMASIVFQRAKQAYETGQVDLQQKAHEEAKQWLDKAVEFDPDNELILNNQRFIQLWPN